MFNNIFNINLNCLIIPIEGFHAFPNDRVKFTITISNGSGVNKLLDMLRAFSSGAIGYKTMQNHSEIKFYFPGIPNSNIIHVLIYPVSESEPAPAITLKPEDSRASVSDT
ncbi:12779_t:CDS:2 [Entrophospora sp. SA101]|nr:12779_t:CDS:2 [Entrophospora sp. SA101]